MNLLLLSCLAATATVLGSTMAFPQARRLARTRRVDGVSPVWIGVSVAINGWWIAYALSAQLWFLLPVSTISCALYATIAAYYVSAVGRVAMPRLLVGALVLGMAPLPFLVAGGWTFAGIAVGLSYGIQLLPAVIAAFRTTALAGVSAGTWLIACGESVLWLGYGLGVTDLALIVGGLAGATMSAVILVRLALTGHRPMSALRRVPLPAVVR